MNCTTIISIKVLTVLVGCCLATKDFISKLPATGEVWVIIGYVAQGVFNHASHGLATLTCIWKSDSRQN